MDTVWFLCPSMLTGAPLTARPSIRVVPLFGPCAEDTMDRTELADITTPPIVTFRLVTEAVESTSFDQLIVATEGGSAVSMDWTLAVSCEASRASFAPPRLSLSGTMWGVAVRWDPNVVTGTEMAFPVTVGECAVGAS